MNESIQVSDFGWDKANIVHIARHKVTVEEAEEVFSDAEQVLIDDVKHSTVKEKRFIIIGKAESGRVLYQVFTLRIRKIRVISSRDINKKEVKLYEKAVSGS